MLPQFELSLGPLLKSGQIWHPPGEHKWETQTEVPSIGPKIGMACGEAIIQACTQHNIATTKIRKEV